MTPIALVLAASLLGLLSFFEPCTIATHTIFSVHAHAHRTRWRELALLWLTRSLLAAGLFALAVAATAPPRWSDYLPSLILAGMASVYIVSRFVYVPVPHFEFFRLIPGGARLPPAMQLGLTLPACTLPLFVVTLGLLRLHSTRCRLPSWAACSSRGCSRFLPRWSLLRDFLPWAGVF